MLYRKMIWTLRIINSIKSGVCRASTWADFSKVSDDYDKFRIPVGRDFIAGMSQLYTGKRLQDLHILDIGCGTGQYAKEMLDLGVGRISLIDASPDMLNAAKYKLANEIEQDPQRGPRFRVLSERGCERMFHPNIRWQTPQSEHLLTSAKCHLQRLECFRYIHVKKQLLYKSRGQMEEQI
ncbi:hypothetical protein MAR_014168 [Mya arenaria]|uniref:Methyltransferase domain-containing protein n=1 Tax=Mya arenaria TaxID=6604 RepID=A0ABY7G516_MYAAR|nr:hypothetical protein MAR_014168 [Mya arenaria]